MEWSESSEMLSEQGESGNAVFFTRCREKKTFFSVSSLSDSFHLLKPRVFSQAHETFICCGYKSFPFLIAEVRFAGIESYIDKKVFPPFWITRLRLEINLLNFCP